MHSPLNTNFTYHGVTYLAGTDQEAVALGDNFLSIVVPQIEASQAFKDNGVIVIWNDETEGDESVGSTAGFNGTEIVISPLAKGDAYTNGVHYTHASDLRTWAERFRCPERRRQRISWRGGRRNLARGLVQAGHNPLRHPGNQESAHWRRPQFAGSLGPRRASPPLNLQTIDQWMRLARAGV